ncbi:MAG TPA: c-type cytochrome [Polyangia bacterium]|jgi:cytochrome c oxidase cbb3-type subunit 3/ubiquinol-cytochrome c reductase cytochrome c subunit|nr:c-type cytochrome [Polyangia bacterium]
MDKIAALFLALLVGACARKPPAPANPAVAKGSQVYANLCATCHGASGNGYVADNAPSLRSPTFLGSASDAFLIAGIARGRPGTAMAGYARAVGGPLDPGDVNALVAYLRDGGPPRLELPPDAVAGDPKAGKVTYQTMCARCHGTQTQRSTAIHLANPILLETASDAFLRWATVEGRPPTSMVPWKDTLRPQQIDDVVAYLRSMAVSAGVTPPPPPPSAPRRGPIVINPRGRHATFVPRDDRFVSIDQLKEALDKKRRLIIADARAPSDWLRLHIVGAISTPYYDPKSLDDLPNDGTWILAYCGCPHHLSGDVVDALRKRGYRHTAIIDEGIYAWQQKGYPVVTAPDQPPSPAPPPAHP